MRAGGRHVFHAAAGGDERVLKNGKLPRPSDRVVQGRRHEIKFIELHFSHSKAPFFHAYTNPKIKTAKKVNISMSPVHLSSFKMTAHGKSHTISTSNRIKSIA